MEKARKLNRTQMVFNRHLKHIEEYLKNEGQIIYNALINANKFYNPESLTFKSIICFLKLYEFTKL